MDIKVILVSSGAASFRDRGFHANSRAGYGNSCLRDKQLLANALANLRQWRSILKICEQATNICKRTGRFFD